MSRQAVSDALQSILSRSFEEQATGIVQRGGLGSFYPVDASADPAPLDDLAARDALDDGSAIAVPNAGAGSYREFLPGWALLRSRSLTTPVRPEIGVLGSGVATSLGSWRFSRIGIPGMVSTTMFNHNLWPSRSRICATCQQDDLCQHLSPKPGRLRPTPIPTRNTKHYR